MSMRKDELIGGIGKLPDDVVIEILIRAGVSEWTQISCVNKHWASLFRSECFWQAALSITFPFAHPPKTCPGPIPIPPPALSNRRFIALYISQHILATDPQIQVDEIVGHTYLFLKDQLQLSIMPPHSGILHGTIIDQFIACGKSRDMAHELASRIWLAVLDNLEENHHTFYLLKRLAQEGDQIFLPCPFAPAITPRPRRHPDVTCPPAFAWFVPEPHRTGRCAALIPFVTSLTALWNDDCPHKPTRVFSACFVLTHTLPGKTSQEVTHPRIAPSQARLTVEFLSDGLPKRRCILLV